MTDELFFDTDCLSAETYNGILASNNKCLKRSVDCQTILFRNI